MAQKEKGTMKSIEVTAKLKGGRTLSFESPFRLMVGDVIEYEFSKTGEVKRAEGIYIQVNNESTIFYQDVEIE